MSFSHKAIYGTTGSGKTWLMKRRATALRHYKQMVIVYGATSTDDWPAGTRFVFEIDDLELMLEDKKNWGAFVFIDEAADLCEDVKPKIHKNCYRLFRKGRHRGYTCFIATQYPTGIWPKIRRNCTEMYCFSLPDQAAADMLWRDYGMKSIDGVPIKDIIPTLPKLHYVHVKLPDLVEIGML